MYRIVYTVLPSWCTLAWGSLRCAIPFTASQIVSNLLILRLARGGIDRYHREISTRYNDKEQILRNVRTPSTLGVNSTRSLSFSCNGVGLEPELTRETVKQAIHRFSETRAEIRNIRPTPVEALLTNNNDLRAPWNRKSRNGRHER